jgi:hypothetical protein
MQSLTLHVSLLQDHCDWMDTSCFDLAPVWTLLLSQQVSLLRDSLVLNHQNMIQFVTIVNYELVNGCEEPCYKLCNRHPTYQAAVAAMWIVGVYYNQY